MAATCSTIAELKSQQKETATPKNQEELKDPSKTSPTCGGHIEGYAGNRQVLADNIKEEEDSGDKRHNGETQMTVDAENIAQVGKHLSKLHIEKIPVFLSW